MLLRLLEEGRQVDEILFCDTGLEFPQMYDHLEKLERYIGRPITRLKAPYTFEQYFYEYQAKGDAALVMNRGLSWPSHACRWCTGRLKTHVINKHLRELKKQYQLVQYVGIAADEAHRCKDLHYPLVEWGMTEADCLNYCYARGFDWGGLYKIFRRVRDRICILRFIRPDEQCLCPSPLCRMPYVPSPAPPAKLAARARPSRRRFPECCPAPW